MHLIERRPPLGERGGTSLEAMGMSTSRVAFVSVAAPRLRRPAGTAFSKIVVAGTAITGLVLGCAWMVYANVFAASPYPQFDSVSFEAHVSRSASVAIRTAFAELEPRSAVSTPAPVSPQPSLSFEDRFAAASAQGVAPAPQPEPSKVAEAPKQQETDKQAETQRAKDTPAKQSARVQVASVPPAPPPAEPAPKTADSVVHDLAQRAKAAVMSITSSDRQKIVEKLWGKQTSPLLAYASADASVTASIAPAQNPALGGSPPYDRSTAVYDISAHTVYLPDGTRLEAHSGLGPKLDDPGSANIRMRGVTPPHIYELKPREALFHGVPALRLTPIGGEEAIYGRAGLLAHTYMLGPNGDSNGCVSFKDYSAFLNAYHNQGIRKLAVLARVE
jgi:hypothetical protein